MFKWLSHIITFRRVCFIVTAVSLFYILTSQTVTEAILDFCFGGIVPGTDIVIPPDVMIMGVTALLGLMLVLGLLVLLVRRIALRQAIHNLINPSQDAPIIAQAAEAVRTNSKPRLQAQPQSVVAQSAIIAAQQLTRLRAQLGKTARLRAATISHTAKSRAASSRKRAQLPDVTPLMRTVGVTTRSIGRVLAMATWLLLSGLLTALIAAKRGIHWLAWQLRLGALQLWEVLAALAQFITRVVLWILIAMLVAETYLVRVVRRGARAVWAWFKPLAARFDTWLDVRYQKLTATSGRKLMRFELFQVLSLMARESKRSIREFFK